MLLVVNPWPLAIPMVNLPVVELYAVPDTAAVLLVSVPLAATLTTTAPAVVDSDGFAWVPVYVTKGILTFVGFPLLPMLTTSLIDGPLAFVTIESVWNLGDFKKSTLTSWSDPVDILVG